MINWSPIHRITRPPYHLHSILHIQLIIKTNYNTTIYQTEPQVRDNKLFWSIRNPNYGDMSGATRPTRRVRKYLTYGSNDIFVMIFVIYRQKGSGSGSG